MIDEGPRPVATTRSEVLRLLKRRGELGVDDLAEALGITPSGIRQQLGKLTADGFVAHRHQRGTTGRPKHLYRLTPAAESVFPRRYRDLVGELLAVASEDDPALVERMFAKRGARRLEGAKERLAGTLEQRVRTLADILDDDGYLAEVEPTTSGWRIIERNCAIIDVARRYGCACASELDFLRAALPDARVERVQHLVAGASCCAYEVRGATAA